MKALKRSECFCAISTIRWRHGGSTSQIYLKKDVFPMISSSSTITRLTRRFILLDAGALAVGMIYSIINHWVMMFLSQEFSLLHGTDIEAF